jgi:G3E family GTPase
MRRSRFPFLTQATDRGRLPVALLSGFLGSGKTTLVNAMLRDSRLANTAVAVNEFGEVPLDQDLIDHGADKTVVMANGCLCCNLSGDMEEAVMRLFSRREDGQVPRFERLIIEPSGLSDPTPIAQAILRNPLMSRSLRLEAIVTTVDVMFAQRQLARHAQTRKQIALADRIVLTKTDLAPDEPVRKAVRAINAVAPVLDSRHGQIDAAALFPDSFFNPSAPPNDPGSGLYAEYVDDTHLERIVSVALSAQQPLQWGAFDDWLRRIRLGHGESLLRVKGMLDIQGANGPVVVQGVHHVVNAPVLMDAWPPSGRQSRLVLIADDATVTAAERSWADALPSLIAH